MTNWQFTIVLVILVIALAWATETLFAWIFGGKAKVSEIEAMGQLGDSPVDLRSPWPVDMILFGMQHVDAPDELPDRPLHPEEKHTLWTNPPHKTHLCAACGLLWRPSGHPTNGVIKLEDDGGMPIYRPVMWPAEPLKAIGFGSVHRTLRQMHLDELDRIEREIGRNR